MFFSTTVKLLPMERVKMMAGDVVCQPGKRIVWTKALRRRGMDFAHAWINTNGFTAVNDTAFQLKLVNRLTRYSASRVRSIALYCSKRSGRKIRQGFSPPPSLWNRPSGLHCGKRGRRC